MRQVRTKGAEVLVSSAPRVDPDVGASLHETICVIVLPETRKAHGVRVFLTG